jgi:hypothetical protein
MWASSRPMNWRSRRPTHYHSWRIAALEGSCCELGTEADFFLPARLQRALQGRWMAGRSRGLDHIGIRAGLTKKDGLPSLHSGRSGINFRGRSGTTMLDSCLSSVGSSRSPCCHMLWLPTPCFVTALLPVGSRRGRDSSYLGHGGLSNRDF